MTTYFSLPTPRVLLSSRAAPSLVEEARKHLRRHGLDAFELPAAPPASPEAFRELTRNVVCALLDFDQPGPSLAWQAALREKRPALPIVALFENACLADLLPAGAAGLNGALQLPARDAVFDQVITPLMSSYGMPPRGLLTESPGPGDAATPPAPRHPPRLPAKHLAPHSPGNQTLLRQLADNSRCSRFIVRGPPGAEFHLVALELAALRGVAESNIAFDARDNGGRHPLLVTTDSLLFSRTTASCAVLIDTAKLIDPSPDEVLLDLLPLHRRPQDIAFYVKRWLPALAHAAHRAAPLPSPLPLSWRHALLTCPWPGEFDQLWRTLQRLALLTEETRFPAPLDAVIAVPGLDSALPAATARAFRVYLQNRIPEGLLSAMLSALGCPEISTSHA